MFDNLSEKLQSVFQRLRGKGRITESDVNEAMREVRLALLEADVHLKVVKEFIATVKEKSLGSDVLESLSPVQQVVKIVNDALVELLGGTETGIQLAPTPPTILMLCGLQGAGKTTLCGKLANHYRKQGRNPLLVACDIYRPAAVKQLQVLGEQVKTPVFTTPPDGKQSPPSIARAAVQYAAQNGNDIIILDTAGRLAIDEDLMDELGQIKAWVKPHEILLVVDAMVGQDAVNFAQVFQDRLQLTGFVMTKMDGDTRGGAALSIRSITGVPIKFMGVGEKLDALETFYPDRLASRILGMGDILSLIEKAQEAVDEKQAMEMERKLRENKFDLNDFLDQMQSIKKLGPVENLLKLLPGVNSKMLEGVNIDPKLMARKEAIVRSMTPKERTDPSLLNGNRRKRVAAGSGHTVQEVNQFLNEFEQMRKMVRQMMQHGPGGPGKGRGARPGDDAPSLPPVGTTNPLKKMPKGGKSNKFRRFW